MALNTVNLQFTEEDAGTGAGSGNVTIIPTSIVVAAGQTVVSQAPIVRALGGGTVTVTLVACDNTGTTPAAGFWAYQITLPGQVTPGVYLVNFANGATQRFDNLTPAVASTTYGPAAGAGSGSFNSPMTTVGDMIVENSVPAAARLAGPTTGGTSLLTSTPSGGSATVPAWSQSVNFGAYTAPAVSALTFGGSIPVNAALGNVFTVTLTASTGTIANPTNPVNGQHIIIEVTQDGTGSRTVAWGTAYNFGAGAAPVLSTAPGATDMLGFVYSSASSSWLFAGTTAPAAATGQFYVNQYGALGNGKIGTGGTGTSGLNTFSDAGAAWTAADVGKYIIINQGAKGAFQNPFCGTISQVTDGQHIVLSGNLAANAASAPYIYGTDDAPAITAAVNAAATWAQATGGPYHAQVIFGDKNYMLGTLTQQSGANEYNTHVPIPIGPQAGQKLVIDLIGTGTGMDAGNAQWPFTTIPNLHGTCLVSAVFATGQPDGTFGQLSVIGGPNTVGTGPLANTVLTVDGITCVAPWNSPTDGVNGNLLTQMNVVDGGYIGFAPINGNNVTCGGPNYQANGYISAGSHAFVFPAFLNNDSNNVGLISVQGAGTGVQLTEHFTAQKLNLIYCGTAMQVSSVSQPYHGATILQVSSEGSNIVLGCSGSSTGRFPVWIGLMDTEFINSQSISDAGNFLGGVIYWATADSNAHFPAVTGGANLTVIDVTHNGPGFWSSAPAAPATGGASSNTQQNTSYRYATIYASATTGITNVWTGAPSVSTGLTATGLAGGNNVVVPVRVPPGAYWSVAFTGTLTTKWALD